MNDYAARYSGDDVFKRVMIGTTIFGAIFAAYMMLY
tara:strand:- start:52 stop:159 length:108 start_codon:yes stop_codon:yes gene_type:complete